MVEVNIIIKMEVLNMKVILLMVNLMVMGNIIGKMVYVILDNLKMIQEMERVRNILWKVILDMKVIILMVKEKDMGKNMN